MEHPAAGRSSFSPAHGNPAVNTVNHAPVRVRTVTTYSSIRVIHARLRRDSVARRHLLSRLSGVAQLIPQKVGPHRGTT